jgi:predicted dehydrogenase
MAKKIRWGILGAGNIARKFATGLKVVTGSELLTVSSRSIGRACGFAKEYGIPKTYGSYVDSIFAYNV